MKVGRDTLVSGLDEFFKPLDTVARPARVGPRFELRLPCILSVRNFDVHRVIKRLAQALEIKAKFWQTPDGYYTVLYDGRITGTEIGHLIDEFNQPDEISRS